MTDIDDSTLHIRSWPIDGTLARATLRKMHQNLTWVVGCSILAFPLAAGVFYPFVLSPEVATLSMSGSSIIVAVNALLLRRARLVPRAAARPCSSPIEAAA